MRHPDALFDPDEADYDEEDYADGSGTVRRTAADRALPFGRLPELPGDTATDPAGRYAGLLDHPRGGSPAGASAGCRGDRGTGAPDPDSGPLAAADSTPEIVDAEVVEQDGPDGDTGDGR